MRYCQSCATGNGWPAPIASELTTIRKCDACRGIVSCTGIDSTLDAFMRYPHTEGRYDGQPCTCTAKGCAACDGTCGCEACTRSWLTSDLADRIGASWVSEHGS